MKKNRFHIQVRPISSGELTRLRLSGVIHTEHSSMEIKNLVSVLARWSGHPVQLALPVGYPDGQWFDSWTDVVFEIPQHHLEIRLTLAGLPKCQK